MRKMLVIGCVIVLPSIAVAQQAQPMTPQGEFIFKLTGPDLDLISKGLGTQPYIDVVPLMQKMQKQYIDQQPKPKPVDPAKSDAEGREQLPLKPLKSE